MYTVPKYICTSTNMNSSLVMCFTDEIGIISLNNMILSIIAIPLSVVDLKDVSALCCIV